MDFSPMVVRLIPVAPSQTAVAAAPIVTLALALSLAQRPLIAPMAHARSQVVLGNLVTATTSLATVVSKTLRTTSDTVALAVLLALAFQTLVATLVSTALATSWLAQLVTSTAMVFALMVARASFLAVLPPMLLPAKPLTGLVSAHSFASKASARFSHAHPVLLTATAQLLLVVRRAPIPWRIATQTQLALLLAQRPLLLSRALPALVCLVLASLAVWTATASPPTAARPIVLH